MHGFTTATEWLHHEFLERKRGNPRFSLRSFAKKLGLSSGAMHEILSGRRRLTPRQAVRIAERLFPDEAGRTRFVALADGKPPRNSDSTPYQEVSEDLFRVMSDWYHFPILALCQTKGFQSDPHWIANRLGISPQEAENAVHRLERAGLLGRENGTLVPTQQNLATGTDIPSEAIRMFHLQMLDNTREAIVSLPVEERDVTSICMPTSPAKAALAKTLIREFRRTLCAFLEDADKTEVFTLNVAMYPLTRPEPRAD